MRLSLSIDQPTLDAILANQSVADAAAAVGLKRPMILLSDTGVALKVTVQGTRVKVKIGLGADDGELVINLRDVRLPIGSIGGNWLEGPIAALTKKLPPTVRMRREDDELRLRIHGLQVIACGTDGQALCFIGETI